MEIQNTPYCKIGLGVGSPECQVCQKECKVRIISGGPDIGSELAKGQRAGNPGSSGLIIPDSVQTKVDLSKFLAEKFTRGSEQYRAAYAEYSPNFEMGNH